MISLQFEDKAKWLRAQRKFAIAALTMPRVVRKLALREAEFFRRKIVEGIRDQAPAGKPFKPLNPWTEATRKHLGIPSSKILIEHGDLIRNITVTEMGNYILVGVRPGAVNSQGRSLVNIATVQEYGKKNIWIKITPKMIALLAIIARKSGKPLPRKGGRSRAGWIRVDIPARPFIEPVYKKWGWEGAARVRMRQYLAEMAQTLFW